MRTHRLLSLLSLATISCGSEDPGTVIRVALESCCCDDTGTPGTDTDTVIDTGEEPTPECDDLYDPPIGEAILPNEDCLGDAVPVDITFAPEVEWAWAPTDADHPFNQVMMTPVVGNLTDDNGDGAISADDTPDVVFTAYTDPSGGASTYNQSPGALVVLDGDTGSERLYLTELLVSWDPNWGDPETDCTNGVDDDLDGRIDDCPDHPSSRSGVALGDINGDGTPEMCFTTYSYTQDHLVCMTAPDATGNTTVTMVADKPSGLDSLNFQSSYPAIADMDGDGQAEIAVGPAVFNADGTLRFLGTADIGGVGSAATSSMLDLDEDGTLELLAGSTVYDHMGNILWDAGNDGHAAVADLDRDGSPEIVVVHLRSFSVYDMSGSVLLTEDFSAGCYASGGCGGPPTLADFDGDGFPELGVAGSATYTVWDIDPAASTAAKLWENTIIDRSSGSTGASVFDFEDDGIAEVVFADENRFYVWRGTDGADQLGSAGLDPADHASGTANEHPSLADVDGDGSTEIILASNWWAEPTGPSSRDWHGVRAIGSGSGDAWADSRPVWNQHAYFMAHINDDLSVPSSWPAHWTTSNTFRAAQQVSIDSEPGAPLADLVAGEIHGTCFDCTSQTLHIYATVSNAGAADSGPTTAAFVAGGTTYGTVAVPELPSGETTTVGWLEIDISGWTDGSLMEVVVDSADEVEECNEENNASSTWGLTFMNECL